MKKIYKFLLLLSLVFIGACESTDLNLLDNNPNAVTPNQSEPNFVYNGIQLSFNTFIRSANFHGKRLTRLDSYQSSLYNNGFTPGNSDFIWSIAYNSLLNNIENLLPGAQDAGLTFHTGTAKIMKAYTLMTLVDLFGDVPLSEALQGSANFNPSFDAGTDIYAVALASLDDGLNDLAATETGLPEVDLYYDLDKKKWITLAKTIKLKLYQTTGNVAAATQIIADGDLIDTVDEDFQFQYGTNRTNPNTRHPEYNNAYESGHPGYESNSLMFEMAVARGFEDPRLRYYYYRQDGDTTDENQFTLGCATQSPPSHYAGFSFCIARTDGYWGRDHGDSDGIPPDGQKVTVVGVYPAGGKFDDDSFEKTANLGTDGGLGAGITPILLSSYVSFMKAENALDNGNVAGAKTLMETGVTQSFDKVLNFLPSQTDPAFAPTPADINTYMLDLGSRFDAASNKLDVIMKEYWVASFGNGIEPYNNYRRTGFPSDLQPMRLANPGDFPRSLFYPSVSVERNSNVQQKQITQQVFWDTNAPGFIN